MTVGLVVGVGRGVALVGRGERLVVVVGVVSGVCEEPELLAGLGGRTSR
ncbi:MAG: hypothetical protein ACXV2G_11090 [Actinomycetes bacterium]